MNSKTFFSLFFLTFFSIIHPHCSGQESSSAYCIEEELKAYSEKVAEFIRSPHKRARDEQQAQYKSLADFIRNPKEGFLRQQKKVKQTLSMVQTFIYKPLYVALIYMHDKVFADCNQLLYSSFSINKHHPLYNTLEAVESQCSQVLDHVRQTHSSLMRSLWYKHLLLHTMEGLNPTLSSLRTIRLTNDPLYSSYDEVLAKASKEILIPAPPTLFPFHLLPRAAEAYRETYRVKQNKYEALAAFNNVTASLTPSLLRFPLKTLLPSFETLLASPQATSATISNEEKHHLRTNLIALLDLIETQETQCFILNTEKEEMLLTSESLEDLFIQKSEHKTKEEAFTKALFTHISHTLILEYLEYFYLLLYHYYAERFGINLPPPVANLTILAYTPEHAKEDTSDVSSSDALSSQRHPELQSATASLKDEKEVLILDNKRKTAKTKRKKRKKKGKKTP